MYLRLPKDRVAVAIGPEGLVKREIEVKTGAKLAIDSETGETKVESGDDPLGALRASEVLKAIARGFSPERAFRLFDDDQFVDIVDIRDYAGDSEKALKRLKGRVIGEGGRSREAIERETGTCISVYGKTVAVIGTAEQLQVVREALDMLLKGAEHTTVYRFLERKKKAMKKGLQRMR